MLAVNAFWWLPGIWLAADQRASDFVLTHPEGVLQRLQQIASTEVAHPVRFDRARACRDLSASCGALLCLAGPSSALAPPGLAGAIWRVRAGRSTSCSRAGTRLRFSRPWPCSRRGSHGRAAQAAAGRPCAAARGSICWAIAGVLLIGVRLIGFPQRIFLASEAPGHDFHA